MIRTFAVAEDAGGVVHDPATGLTHCWTAPHVLAGRQALSDSQVIAASVLHPATLGRRMPTSLCWSPIVRCNLACPHCLDDTRVVDAGALRRRHIAGLLSQADILGVDITGGEPLLLRDLPNLARSITLGDRTTVSVTTNGWLLPRRATELVGAVDAVRVSFDGPTAEHHDRLRGQGSFDRAVAGVRAALAAELPVQLQSVVMATSACHLQAIVDLANRLGAGGVTFLQMLPIGAGARLAEAEALDDDRASDLVDRLEVPDVFRLRLRTRNDAGGFTVVRADGQVWRNNPDATGIGGVRPFTTPDDLALSGRDGSA